MIIVKIGMRVKVRVERKIMKVVIKIDDDDDLLYAYASLS